MIMFEGEAKADFRLKPMTGLKELINADSLPDKYNLGYDILLDKDGLTRNTAKPEHSGFTLTKPEEATFVRDIRHFWTAVSTAAKYIRLY